MSTEGSDEPGGLSHHGVSLSDGEGERVQHQILVVKGISFGGK